MSTTKKVLLDAYRQIPELAPEEAIRPPQVAALMDGEPLKPDDDGFIGEGFEGWLTLQAKTPKGVHGINVNGYRYASLKGFRVESDGRKFKQKVTIQESKLGSYTTAEDNTLRLITLSKDGWFEAWQASIVGQRGRFWLVTQKAYEEQVFLHQSSGKLMMRHCSWKADSLFREILDDTSQIPEDSWNLNKRQNREVKTSDLSEGEARVLFFSPASGTGVLVNHQEQKLKVYWANVSKRSGTQRQFLLADEKVKYANTRAAGQRSSLSSEAVGVTVIERKDSFQ